MVPIHSRPPSVTFCSILSNIAWYFIIDSTFGFSHPSRLWFIHEFTVLFLVKNLCHKYCWFTVYYHLKGLVGQYKHTVQIFKRNLQSPLLMLFLEQQNWWLGVRFEIHLKEIRLNFKRNSFVGRFDLTCITKRTNPWNCFKSK